MLGALVGGDRSPSRGLITYAHTPSRPHPRWFPSLEILFSPIVSYEPPQTPLLKCSFLHPWFLSHQQATLIRLLPRLLKSYPAVLRDTGKSSLWAASANGHHSWNSHSMYTNRTNHPACLSIISYYLLLSNARFMESCPVFFQLFKRSHILFIPPINVYGVPDLGQALRPLAEESQE